MIILALLLVVGILYPDDPDNRSARTIRAMVAVIAFSAMLAAGHATVGLFYYRTPLGPTDLVNIVAWIQYTAVPFSIAERVAELFKPRRTLPWALTGVSTCLAGSALIYVLMGRYSVPPLSWPAMVIEYVTPGLVAGLAWYAYLPRREQDVAEVFG